MPAYDYQCDECKKIYIRVHSITDESDQKCPDCKGTMHRKPSISGVSFTGTGFYRTDRFN